MQLNAELVDVTGNFRPLGFVLFKLSFQISNLRLSLSRLCIRRRNRRNRSRPSASLALKGHAGRGGVDYERRRTVSTRERDVVRGRSHRWRSVWHDDLKAGEMPARGGAEMTNVLACRP
jgi:hypothetical protein